MAKVSKVSVLSLLTLVLASNAQSQTGGNDDYLQVVKERAYKIAAPLEISDSVKFYRVRDRIAQEYADIKKIDEDKTVATAAIKSKNFEKAVAERELKKLSDATEEQRAALNKKFVQSLSKDLNAQQIEKVKDGLTYNVLQITYKAHLDMIPSLKEEEKKYIYDALFEAREHAMAAGSSDAKHGWFGKYKGRINNYLAARGYDLKKEREAWYERTKAQKK
jgi:16S rRNA C1402 (ribose-2'-O) methylase RsmI